MEILEEKEVDGVRVRRYPEYSYYWVSACGRVWSDGRSGTTKLGRWLKQQRDTDNYPIVGLSENNKVKTHKVANLVARCWIGPVPFEGAQVLHEKDDKNNSHVSALSYGTHQENMDSRSKNGKTAKGSKNGCALLTEDEALLIKQLLASGCSRSQVEQMTRKSRVSIYNIDKNISWRHLT